MSGSPRHQDDFKLAIDQALDTPSLVTTDTTGNIDWTYLVFTRFQPSSDRPADKSNYNEMKGTVLWKVAKTDGPSIVAHTSSVDGGGKQEFVDLLNAE